MPQAPAQGSPGASLPQGLHRDQARWVYPGGDPGPAEGRPRGLLCSLSLSAPWGNPGAQGTPEDPKMRKYLLSISAV